MHISQPMKFGESTEEEGPMRKVGESSPCPMRITQSRVRWTPPSFHGFGRTDRSINPSPPASGGCLTAHNLHQFWCRKRVKLLHNLKHVHASRCTSCKDHLKKNILHGISDSMDCPAAEGRKGGQMSVHGGVDKKREDEEGSLCCQARRSSGALVCLWVGLRRIEFRRRWNRLVFLTRDSF